MSSGPECECTDFAPHAFKQGYCRNCGTDTSNSVMPQTPPRSSPIRGRGRGRARGRGRGTPRSGSIRSTRPLPVPGSTPPSLPPRSSPSTPSPTSSPGVEEIDLQDILNSTKTTQTRPVSTYTAPTPTPKKPTRPVTTYNPPTPTPVHTPLNQETGPIPTRPKTGPAPSRPDIDPSETRPESSPPSNTNHSTNAPVIPQRNDPPAPTSRSEIVSGIGYEINLANGGNSTANNKMERKATVSQLVSSIEELTIEIFESNHPNIALDVEIEFIEKRDRIAYELLTTEAFYTRSLNIVLDLHFPILIQASASGRIHMSQETIKEVFGNLAHIASINEVIYCELKERFKIWLEKPMVGDIIAHLSPFLKMYKIYSATYSTATEILQQQIDKDRTLYNLLESLKESPLSNNMDLVSYLIMPVQRVPRYVLLLMDLIKQTPEGHPDYELSIHALDSVKIVADEINDAINARESEAKNIEVQSLVGNAYQVVAAHRRFILEGDLVKQCRKERKVRRFWLFSDVLLYGFPQLQGPKYALSRAMELKNMRVVGVEDNESNKIEYAFSIAESTKSFLVFGRTEQEKQLWLNTLTNAILELRERNQSLVGIDVGESEIAPVWTPDGSNCEICNKKIQSYKKKASL
eukprot:TRINITY_DN4342_c0_g1_i6.p1 TRINITY_DN4342_c0_g1~~TRINITY_DN4342_c0_g1_i6.p1  ORF type:complete len:641 (-),score=149.43 TRINITY_DN4342_c0_g1_i6:143-2044(-)